MSAATTAALLLATAVAGQQRDLRDTILRACSGSDQVEPLAWLRQQRPAAALLVDALVEPADLPAPQVRSIVEYLLLNLTGLDADLARLWRDEPGRRAARAPAFLALGPEKLARWSTAADAAERADLARVVGLGTNRDFMQLRDLVFDGRRPELAAGAEPLSRAMLAAPHPVDALDLGLLARLDAGPALLRQQIEVREALRPHLDDPRAWMRFALLLGHADPRVRARGAFLLSQARGSLPIGVLAVLAVDPWIPWERVHLTITDETVLRAIAPALLARGAGGLHRMLQPMDVRLPPLSAAARDALGDGLVAVLAVQGAPLAAAQRAVVGHLRGDAAHWMRVQAAVLLGKTGSGARAVQQARQSGRVEVQLAVLDPVSIETLADAAAGDDLRGLWASDDAAVRAGVAQLLARRRNLPPDLGAAAGASALRVVRQDVGDLRLVQEGAAAMDLMGTRPPASADARLVLAACAMGRIELFGPLLQELAQLPAKVEPDPHALFVLRALGQLGPWLAADQARRLFDALQPWIEVFPAEAWSSGTVLPSRSALLEAVAGLVATLPDDRLVRLQRLLAMPQHGAAICQLLPERGLPLSRQRVLWLLETWPKGCYASVPIWRAAPEQLVVAWHTGGSERHDASHQVRRLCEVEPQLAVALCARRVLVVDLLAAALLEVRDPAPELLAHLAEASTLTSWTSRWFDRVRTLDPGSCRAPLERISRSPDHRFAVAAAEALVRGDEQASRIGLRVLEQLAASDPQDARTEALSRCAAAGICSPRLLELARAASTGDSHLGLVGLALLRRAGELGDAQLTALGARRALDVLRLSGSWLAPDRLIGMDPQLAAARQLLLHLPPAPKSAVFEAAAGDRQLTSWLIDAALRDTVHPDAGLRRAAYLLLARADRGLFPQAALVGDAALDDDPAVRAIVGR